MLPKAVKFCRIVAFWTLTCGITGAAIGVVIWVLGGDTGHIPVEKMPIFIGVPGAAIGFCVGIVLGAFAVALDIEVKFGKKGLAVFGAVMALAAVLILLTSFEYTYLTLLAAALPGVSLVIYSFLAKVRNRQHRG
jgi:peptidoglycan/LPS O-acetylase OafA/YrhL